MTRPLRIEYEGAWYHVMNRGTARCNIFHEDSDRECFLNLLHAIHNRYRVEIHAYCLMGNHYHILIRTQIANLSRAIHYLNGVYSHQFNIAKRRDGPLFRGRFKSIIVDAEDYLLRLSRYIHLNPVAAGLINKPEEYRWSSYRAYLNPRSAPSWLITKEVLSRFGAQLRTQKYREFVHEVVDRETTNFFQRIKLLPILGTDAFIKSMSEKYLEDKKISPEISEQKLIHSLPSLERITDAVAKYYQVNPKCLKEANRQTGNLPRTVAIYLAAEITGAKLLSIAEHYENISYSGVSQAVRRFKSRLSSDNRLRKNIQDLIHLINGAAS